MPNEIEIEIVEVNTVDGGVEVFARAWKNGVQLGFGKDGTVDLERFRVFNPPMLVSDPLGDIPREITFQDGTVHQRNLREDPAEAMIETIVHAANQVGKEGTTIIPGSRGNTVTTFYPSYDASISRLDTDTTWSACRDATSGLAVDDTSDYKYFTCEKRATNKFEIHRGYFVFDTSTIGSGQQVDSGTISLNFTGDSSIYQTAGFVDFTSPDSGFTTAEFDVVSGYTEVVTQITPSAANGSYDTWTLNSTGIGLVNMTGKSHYGLVWQYDISNTTPSTTNRNYRTWDMSEWTGTANDPKLVITHSAAAASGPANLKSYNTNLKANIKSINTNVIANVKSLDTNV